MRRILNALSFLVLAGMLFFACGGSSQSEGGEQASTEEAAEAAPETSEAPSTAMGATAKIADWDTWLAAYNEGVPQEVQMGILRSADDPNTVFVFQATEDHATAKERFASEETQADIAESGATDVEFYYYDLVRLSDATPDTDQRFLVSHEVQDFDTWLEAFDSDESNRNDAGMTFVGMARDADNANVVYIMFAASDRDAVDAMVASEEMKQVMQDAGVIGEPTFGWWTAYSE